LKKGGFIAALFYLIDQLSNFITLD
jgi:hypothetical protein